MDVILDDLCWPRCWPEKFIVHDNKGLALEFAVPIEWFDPPYEKCFRCKQTLTLEDRAEYEKNKHARSGIDDVPCFKCICSFITVGGVIFNALETPSYLDQLPDRNVFGM